MWIPLRGAAHCLNGSFRWRSSLQGHASKRRRRRRRAWIPPVKHASLQPFLPDDVRLLHASRPVVTVNGRHSHTGATFCLADGRPVRPHQGHTSKRGPARPWGSSCRGCDRGGRGGSSPCGRKGRRGGEVVDPFRVLREGLQPLPRFPLVAPPSAKSQWRTGSGSHFQTRRGVPWGVPIVGGNSIFRDSGPPSSSLKSVQEAQDMLEGILVQLDQSPAAAARREHLPIMTSTSSNKSSSVVSGVGLAKCR